MSEEIKTQVADNNILLDRILTISYLSNILLYVENAFDPLVLLAHLAIEASVDELLTMKRITPSQRPTNSCATYCRSSDDPDDYRYNSDLM